jgi:hypothetical protein
MFLYLSIILVTMIILYAVNLGVGSVVWGLPPALVFIPITLLVLFEFAIDGLFAHITSKYPRKWFRKDKKIFQVGAREKKFLNFIKVKKWKDQVWELGGLGGFKKDKLYNASDPKYLERFIVESNIGVIVHYNGVFFGLLVVFLVPFRFLFKISLPITCINILLNLMSIWVLRYNTPKLQVALKRAERNQLKNMEKDND